MFNENEILNTLNPLLRSEAVEFTRADIVNMVPFLQTGEPGFLEDLLPKLESDVFLPGECIIRAGSTGDAMYFLNQGVAVVRSNNMELVHTLTDGTYFGEMALLEDGALRTAHVFANSYCYIYRLRKDAHNIFLRLTTIFVDH